ncbi:hypothetical protein FRC10_008971 [Ceratobasidium sp. 414]|nr:hypothetical protein FRC10_008971 [Ceratobasidium sp. 414]
MTKAQQKTATTPRLKHPVILCHGLFGFDHIGKIHYWSGIAKALSDAGADVFEAKVPATSAVDTRARHLKEQIVSHYRGCSVHLIGHSMGGLDCRYLVSHLLGPDAGFEVLSVTTISTPHQGSPVADAVVLTSSLLGGITRPFVRATTKFLGDGKAFKSLSSRDAEKFNAHALNRPGVHYFSWGASFTPRGLERPVWGASHKLILNTEGDGGGENDGLVSVTSAICPGPGAKHLGTIEGTNHTGVVGFKLLHPRLPGKSSKERPPFNCKQFYVDHISMLATEVEKWDANK